VERNLYWVTDGVYNSAFLTTDDGVVVFDAPPSIGPPPQSAGNSPLWEDGDVSLPYRRPESSRAAAGLGGRSTMFGWDCPRPHMPKSFPRAKPG
jgi:hypothetical protein